MDNHSSKRLLKFDQERERETILTLAQIGVPASYKRAWSTCVSSGRRDTSGTAEVGYVCSTMVVLKAVGYVLAWHVVCRRGDIPCLEGIARILSEVGRSRGCGGTVDWR